MKRILTSLTFLALIGASGIASANPADAATETRTGIAQTAVEAVVADNRFDVSDDDTCWVAPEWRNQ